MHFVWLEGGEGEGEWENLIFNWSRVEKVWKIQFDYFFIIVKLLKLNLSMFNLIVWKIELESNHNLNICIFNGRLKFKLKSVLKIRAYLAYLSIVFVIF